MNMKLQVEQQRMANISQTITKQTRVKVVSEAKKQKCEPTMSCNKPANENIISEDRG